jgi:hypothetical protein
MKRFVILIILILFTFSLQVGYASSLTSTLKDQQDAAVTIYNSNIGLVKDTRIIQLSPGVQELKFMDVAAKIDPTSVHIKSLINGSSLNVLEQNYEYDLLNPQKLLEKFVGQKVQLATINPETKKEEIVEATLLSTQGGEYLPDRRQDPHRPSGTHPSLKNSGEPYPSTHVSLDIRE